MNRMFVLLVGCVLLVGVAGVQAADHEETENETENETEFEIEFEDDDWEDRLPNSSLDLGNTAEIEIEQDLDVDGDPIHVVDIDGQVGQDPGLNVTIRGGDDSSISVTNLTTQSEHLDLGQIFDEIGGELPPGLVPGDTSDLTDVSWELYEIDGPTLSTGNTTSPTVSDTASDAGITYTINGYQSGPGNSPVFNDTIDYNLTIDGEIEVYQNLTPEVELEGQFDGMPELGPGFGEIEDGETEFEWDPDNGSELRGPPGSLPDAAPFETPPGWDIGVNDSVDNATLDVGPANVSLDGGANLSVNDDADALANLTIERDNGTAVIEIAENVTTGQVYSVEISGPNTSEVLTGTPQSETFNNTTETLRFEWSDWSQKTFVATENGGGGTDNWVLSNLTIILLAIFLLIAMAVGIDTIRRDEEFM